MKMSDKVVNNFDDIAENPELVKPAPADETPAADQIIVVEDPDVIIAVEAPPEQKHKLPTVEMHSGKFNPDRVKMIVYGDTGVGKTVFASTWPKLVFLDIDDGMASVTREVARIPIKSWDDLQDAYWMLTHEDHGFKTVVIDSTNETQYQAMKNTVRRFSTVKRSYDNQPAIGDYSKAFSDFENFVRGMRALPLNVVFISQLAKRENADDPAAPQFSGKNTMPNITRMMDIIGFLYKGDPEEGKKPPRIMGFDESSYISKDRSGKLPVSIENPTYDKLYKIWTEE
jgi:hypothetical protein